ncbi:MAG: STAS domain-containing protein [Acidimicrobiales bacterium]
MTLVRPPEFSCQTTVDHGQAVVAVAGELDMTTAPELSRSLAPVLDQHPRDVTLDLAGVDFIDSTGLTLLVRTSKALQAHEGALHLLAATPPVRRVLEIVGLDGLLVA